MTGSAGTIPSDGYEGFTETQSWAISTSLTTSTGTLAKTNKAKLAELICHPGALESVMPPNAAHLVDAMAVLHSLTAPANTFGDVAEIILWTVIHGTDKHSRVDFLVNQYTTLSIKSAEQERIAEKGALSLNITSGEQKCPKQWQKCLASSTSKTSLLEFLFWEWCQDKYAALLDQRHLYVTHGNLCHCLVAHEGKVVTLQVHALTCSHTEADTRLLLHAKHAADNGSSEVVIRSQDTDVLLLACHHQRHIPASLKVKSGTKLRPRLYDVQSITQQLGPEMCAALPGLHGFTGCDSTSAFSGKGKKKAYEFVTKENNHRKAMMDLGELFNTSDNTFSACERFATSLYGQPSDDINQVRYMQFCTKVSEGANLPPTQDCL
jgi:hypothetical protein